MELLNTEQKEFFNRLYIFIDRLEDKFKAKVLGKLFKALLNIKIKKEEFLLLTSIIERTYVQDLHMFLAKQPISSFGVSESELLFIHQDRGFIDRLVSVGLYKEELLIEKTQDRAATGKTREVTKSRYKLTSVGISLIRNL